MTPEQRFKERLIDASYHYADDSGKEWNQATKAFDEACQIAFDEGWDDEKVYGLVLECNPIMGYDDVERKLNAKRSASQPRE